MGREVRRVPEGWQHPRDENGHFIPLLKAKETFEEKLRKWKIRKAAWDLGIKINWEDKLSWRTKDEDYPFEDYDGSEPKREDYMPYWPEHMCTYLVMYETTSEGTPISPGFKTPEALADWLFRSRASAFGDMTATYEQWLATIKQGFAPSAVFSPSRGLQSGVAASTDA